MKENILKIRLERDSVHAADDEHSKILSLKESTSLGEVISHILKIHYLASISGGKATWIVKGTANTPLAVLAQQWGTPRFVVDENAPFAKYVGDKIHIEYRQQTPPDDVYEELLQQNPERNIDDLQDKIVGILIGTAVGDALGLPYEGISRRRAKRLFPGKLRHRFLLGRGMISDDTEHTFMVAQTLLDASSDIKLFSRKLAWRLKWWFLRLPAGVGMATAKACMKLWCGFSPKRSGVFSAGNGPAMRAAIFGTVDDDKKRHALVEASTRMTHTDPKALTGAIAVADLTNWIIDADRRNPQTLPARDEVVDLLSCIEPQDEVWCEIVSKMENGWMIGLSVMQFADSLGLQNGVSGYVYHTVPVAIYAWHRHYGDFRKTLESVVECGGDTDTVEAIAGALAGATVGESGIPREWIDGICDTPINVSLLRKTATALAERRGQVWYFWPLSIPRNLFFLLIVLGHGFRRLLPPY